MQSLCRLMPAQLALFINLAYALSLTFTKVSILCLYLRILTFGYTKLLSKILLGVVIVFYTWIVCSLLTICAPIEGVSDPRLESAYCRPTSVFWVNTSINIATDFCIFILPLPAFFKLQIPRRQKIGLCVVFLLAFRSVLTVPSLTVPCAFKGGS